VDIDECFAALGGARPFVIETTGTRPYAQVEFKPGDAFIYGSEHKGLSPAVLDRVPLEQHLTIPMRPGNRSLNLSNSVALVVYEAWRQNGFEGS
jgi:tRNA (cytidine/uridine-2'-O-)-methyltransferase